MNEASAVALGYFDGVHLGHRAVVEAAVRAAKAHGWTPTAFTFTLPHGGAGKGAAILTPQEKCRRLRACGVERVIMPAFEEFCRLTPEEFVQNILVEQMHAAYVFTGDDFTFGAHKAGNVDLLHKLCESRGIRVITVPPISASPWRISTLCRPSLNIMPTLPIGSPVAFSTTAYVSGAANTVRIISRLFPTEVCGGHPAIGPIAGSLAYLYKDSASDSCQARKMSRSVINWSILVILISLRKDSTSTQL